MATPGFFVDSAGTNATLNILLLAEHMGSYAEHKAKVAVLRFLIEQGSLAHGAVILNEYSANSSGIRADFALLQSDNLHGIEIKSEADSLYRLERQLEGYRRCFSSVTIALAENHLPKARPILPAAVGILVIQGNRVTSIRKPKLFRRKKLDVVRALPKKELERFLRLNGVHVAGWNRSQLENATERLSTQAIYQLSADYLRRTYGQYTDDLRDCQNAEVSYANIEKLSRFKAKRDRNAMLLKKRQEIFTNWHNLQTDKDEVLSVNQPNHHQHHFEPA